MSEDRQLQFEEAEITLGKDDFLKRGKIEAGPYPYLRINSYVVKNPIRESLKRGNYRHYFRLSGSLKNQQQLSSNTLQPFAR